MSRFENSFIELIVFLFSPYINFDIDDDDLIMFSNNLYTGYRRQGHNCDVKNDKILKTKKKMSQNHKYII